MPATVEIGAIYWFLGPPDQIIAPAGIPSGQAVGRATFGSGIVATGIQSRQAFGTTQVIPAATIITAYGIPSAQRAGVVVVEIITEGARLQLVAVYQNGYAVAGYQKTYLGYVLEHELRAANHIVAGYQKRYSGFVLEHEFLAAAAELVEA